MSKKISKAQVKRNRKAWLEALRSGKYKQTTGKLKSRNGAYCCLGVLCEVAEVPKKFNGFDYTYGPEDGKSWKDRSSTSLPTQAMEWLGVTISEPKLAKPVTITKGGIERQVSSLITLNDDYGWSFAQIADAIEENGLAEGNPGGDFE